MMHRARKVLPQHQGHPGRPRSLQKLRPGPAVPGRAAALAAAAAAAWELSLPQPGPIVGYLSSS